MATLTVGTDKQYQTVSAAIAASQDGDVIQVDAGTYTNDFAHITTDITLTAVGGMVHMHATVPPPDGKAIFTTDGNITINGFEFSGAAVADQNGAGIRMQTGDLTLNDCYFHHNENGILTSAEGGTLTIDDTEFAFNGGGGSISTAHNLYVGAIDALVITDSYFHDAVVGHEIKSRAATTTITNNRIQDESGTASYSIDVPNGGNVTITGNVIEQGPNSENNYFIEYGGEGMLYASNSLVIDNNVIINNKPTSTPLLFENTSVIPVFTNNDVFGLTAAQLPAGTGTTFLASAPALDTSHPFGTVAPPPPPPPPPPPTGLILTGTKGRDSLVGGDSDDILSGKENADVLITGGGHDTVIFDTALKTNNIDTVFDFDSVNDTIQLRASIFSNPALLACTGGILSYNGSLFAVLPAGLSLAALDIKIV